MRLCVRVFVNQALKHEERLTIGNRFDVPAHAERMLAIIGDAPGMVELEFP
jgi:hypothetical protein